MTVFSLYTHILDLFFRMYLLPILVLVFYFKESKRLGFLCFFTIVCFLLNLSNFSFFKKYFEIKLFLNFLHLILWNTTVFISIILLILYKLKPNILRGNILNLWWVVFSCVGVYGSFILTLFIDFSRLK